MNKFYILLPLTVLLLAGCSSKNTQGTSDLSDGSISQEGNVYTITAAETYTLSGGDLSVTIVNEFSYASFLIYSDKLAIETSYSLASESSTILSWTQTSSSQKIS